MQKDLIQKGWEKNVIPPFRQDLVSKIAKDMVEVCAKLKSGQKVIIFYDAPGGQLAETVAELSSRKGARVWYYVRNMNIDRTLATFMNNRDIARSQTFLDIQLHEADVVFLIRAAEDPLVMGAVPNDKMKLWTQAQKTVLMDFRVNHTNWCLIYWPTLFEARVEKIPYEEYVNLFFSACNQPWEKIKEAQKQLVKVLNKGKALEISANQNDPNITKRTKIAMDIGPMTFANTIIDVNYPGSEVFSSPVKHSVNGQIFAPGVYSYAGKKMEDIGLIVKDGRIIDAQAKDCQTSPI